MANWLPTYFTSAFESPSTAPAKTTEYTNASDYTVSGTLDPSLITSQEQIASLVCSRGPDKKGYGNTNNCDQVDSQIAQALTNLSLHERDKVYHEIHGVDDSIEETPELIQQRLQEFHAELYRIKDTHSKGGALRMALQQDSSSQAYVLDANHGLRFLRADSFDVSKAADRMIRYFDLKLYFFGPELLCQEVTMDDLSKDDRETLQAGFIQLLPVRDRAGRAIIMIVPIFRSLKNPADNFSRVLFYMFMCSLDDEETQRRGMTAIIYDAGVFDARKTDLKTVAHGAWVTSTIPVKINALHHCFDDRAFRIIIDLSMKFFSREITARAKLHQGAHLECVYALMTFGIPPDVICVSVDGDLKRKNHLEWIKMRKRQEYNSRDTKRMPLSCCLPRIVVPSRADVLFGRGKSFREHIGNLRLNMLLDENLERYKGLTMKEKSTVIAEMVAVIRAGGGRFLMKEDGLCWEEVDIRQAHEKVSHAFRTRQRIKRMPDQQGDRKSSKTSNRPDECSLSAEDVHSYQGAKRARSGAL